MTGPHVVVVGAGIVGASIAYHLAARGARVTLVEAAGPAAGVTRRAFAWLNIAHTRPHPYQALRQSALQDWRRLEGELDGALAVSWCGALSWDADLSVTERLVEHHVAAGYDVRLVDRAEIATVEPALSAPPRVAAYAAGEGAVDPVEATLALIGAAMGLGADLRIGAGVTALEVSAGRVIGVRMGDRTIAADTVVAAAGLGSVDLCERAGVALPVSASPATLLRMSAGRTQVRGIVAGPDFEIREGAGGLLLAAADYIDDTPENGPEAVGRRMAAAVRAGVRDAEDISLIAAEPGWRPMPEDGAPIVGFAEGVDGLYLAAMHAAIILAPVVGRLAAAEILDGIEAPELAPCRLARFPTAT